MLDGVQTTNLYKFDFVKSNIREISKSIISKAAVIFEKWWMQTFLRFFISLQIWLFEYWAMNILKITIGHF